MARDCECRINLECSGCGAELHVTACSKKAGGPELARETIIAAHQWTENPLRCPNCARRALKAMPSGMVG